MRVCGIAWPQGVSLLPRLGDEKRAGNGAVVASGIKYSGPFPFDFAQG
jgi:hypothetical protein